MYKRQGRYWGQYTALGDTFLENLQGLTTLKIYQAYGYKQEELNREAEKFRRITMKVLTMQLNSITIMDLVASVSYTHLTHSRGVPPPSQTVEPIDRIFHCRYCPVLLRR